MGLKQTKKLLIAQIIVLLLFSNTAISSATGYISGQSQPVIYEDFANSGILNFDPPYQPEEQYQARVLNKNREQLELDGWVWNTNLGWTSLKCDETKYNRGIYCGDYVYGLTVDKNSGLISGYAWNDNTGYISFSCENDLNGCTATNTHKVKIETDPNCIGTIYNSTSYKTPPSCPTHTESDSFAWSDTVGWIDLSGVIIPYPPQILSLNKDAGGVEGGNTIEINGNFFAKPVYSQEINITNNSSALTDYQTKIILNTANLISSEKMREDCGDIDFYDSDKETKLPYFIEPNTCNTNNTVLWVKTDIPATSTKKIYATYNGYTTKKHPENVFYFYEDFETDLYKWEQTKTASTSTIQLTSQDSFEGEKSVEVYQTTSNGETYLSKNIDIDKNTILEAEFYDQNTNATHVIGDKDFYVGTYGSNNTYYYYDSTGWKNTGINRSKGWQNIKLIFTGTNGQIFINNTSGGTTTQASKLNQIRVMQHLTGAQGYLTDLIKVRQYTPNEPTISFGAETTKNIEVKFGENISNSVNFINDKKIEVEVPESTTGTGSVDVTLINPNGQKDTIKNGYTYNPAPTVTSIDPVEGEITGGTSIEIEGTNFYSIYETPITIENTSETLKNHQISFILDTSTLISDGKMREDCGNLRIKDTDNSSILPYWIEDGTCDKTTTKIWTKVPTIEANDTTTIYATYGNPNQTQAENGNEVFEFFDDFNEQSINQEKWQGDSEKFTTSNGQLTNTSTTQYRLESIKQFNDPIILEFKHKTGNDGSPTNGYQIGGFLEDATNGLGYLQQSTTDYIRSNGSYISISPSSLPEDVEMLISYAIKNNNAKIKATNYNTNAELHSTTITNSISREKIAIGKRYDELSTSQNYDGSWDWIYVRKYEDAKPTTTIGAETVKTPKIYLGNSEATSTLFQSPTYLTATSSAGTSGPVNVTVKNPDDQEGEIQNGYTYIDITDPEKSTFTATPQTVIADGISTSFLTATLKNSNEDPVIGATVNVSATAVNIRPINCKKSDIGIITKGRSNLDGKACFLTTSNLVANNVNFTATDTTNSIEIEEKAKVTFTNCFIDPSSSTFTASKTEVQANNTDYAELNLHLKDICGNDVDKTNVVTIKDNSNNEVTHTPPGSPAPQTYSTSGGGLLSTTIKSIKSGIFTFSAELNEKIYNNTLYIEETEIPNEYNGSGAIITGSQNQDNKELTFNMPFDFSLYEQTINQGSPIYICTNGYISLTSNNCKSSGQLTNAIAGYYMDLTTNDGGIYQRTTANSITFVFETQTKTSEKANFEIKLYKNNKIEIHYKEIESTAQPFIGLYDSTSTPMESELQSPYKNTATSFEQESPQTIFNLDNHPEVEFLAGDIEITNSSIIAEPTEVTADGKSFSKITVKIQDENENPIPQREIQLSQDGASTIKQVKCDDITEPANNELTDANGQTCYIATNEIAQLVTFTATDITELPIIIGSKAVDFGCAVGAGQQCLQISLKAGEGAITMTTPSNFSFLPALSSVLSQKQFTCDDEQICKNNETGYIHNIDDILTVTDTRNLGGFTVQIQASTPFETEENSYLPFQNFFVATTPSSTGGTKINGIEYEEDYDGITCQSAPLNTTGSLLNSNSFLFNFGVENQIPSQIHDLMQCEVAKGEGRNTTMKQNVNFHLLLPPSSLSGLYQVTLTYDLLI